MTAYAVFLRGISPMNAKMAHLVRAFEKAGFTEVATVLGSGNVVLRSKRGRAAVEERALAATDFAAFVRPIDYLAELLATDPFARFDVPSDAKRVVTFLFSAPAKKPKLPATLDKATIHAVIGGEAFSSYRPQPGNPVFMTLIERTLGKKLTTRTWDTIAKVVARAPT